MSKYAPLGAFLKAQPCVLTPCSFGDIEKILGFKLPSSAYQHRAWWSNNPTNNVMTKEWLEAGFETVNVDIEAQRLVFRKLTSPTVALPKQMPRHAGMADVARPFSHQQGTGHPLRGALKGTIRITVDVDLTLPADPDWADTL